MKDTELQARLIKLGMPADQAARTTAQIRDRLHPVAVVASKQMREAVAINQKLAGLGYIGEISDETLGSLEGGTLSKIGKALKKVVKQVSKVAAVIPGPWMLPAAAATAGFAARDKKKATKKAIAAAAAASNMTPKEYKLRLAADNADAKAKAAALKAAALPPGKKKTKAEKAAAKLAAKAAKAATKAGISLSEQVAAGAPAVPTAVVNEAANVAAASLQSAVSSGGGAAAVSTTPVDFMQDQLSAQGMNFSSPAAQGVLQDVAAEGVQATPEGPSPLPPWVLPVGAAVAIGALLMMSRKR